MRVVILVLLMLASCPGPAPECPPPVSPVTIVEIPTTGGPAVVTQP